jgi:hypothetical protein
VLQSHLTSLIGVSISNVDYCIATGSFSTIWGVTSGAKQLNFNDYMLLHSAGNNSYIQIRGSNLTTGNNLLIGLLTDDCFMRLPKSTSVFKFQNSSPSDIMTIDNSGNAVHLGNITVSETLQTGGSYLFGSATNRCQQSSDHMAMSNSSANASYTSYTDI